MRLECSKEQIRGFKKDYDKKNYDKNFPALLWHLHNISCPNHITTKTFFVIYFHPQNLTKNKDNNIICAKGRDI